MPIEIGLLSTQQDSFEHHEELSKLLNETDVRRKIPLVNLLLLRNYYLKRYFMFQFDMNSVKIMIVIEIKI